MWQRASEEEKAPYVAMYHQDKHRYQAELEAFNYRLAAAAASQTAGQAMQAVAAAQRATNQHHHPLLPEVRSMNSRVTMTSEEASVTRDGDGR